MKKLSITLGLFGFVAALAGAFAEPPTDAPSDPVLPRAPAFASWTISYKYPEPTEEAPVTKPSDRVVSVEVTKTGANVRQITRRESGKLDERWIFEGEQMRTAPDLDVIVIIPPASAEYASPDYRDLGKGDFEGLDWLSRETFQGVKELDGKKGFYFEATKGGKKLSALLSRDTQLPLRFSDGLVIGSYTFNPPPAAALALPQRFKDALLQQKKGKETLKRIPSPP